MASFAIDIGHGRSICIEASAKGVEINTYSTLPSGQLVKVSSRSILLGLKSWKKFNDNLEDIKTLFNNLTEDTPVTTDFTLHLGNLFYIRAISAISCIHIRKYYFDEERTLKPGRPGVAFKYPEFRELLSNLPDINKVTSIESVESCCTADTQKDCKVCMN